jgi:hypothetical protein
LWIALSALSLWLALRAIERDHWLDWALFVLAQIAAAYLYYLELLFLGALTLYVLLQVRRRPRLVARWFVALTVIALALSPWYLQPDLLSGGEYGGTAGRLDPALYLSWFLPSLLFGEAIPPGRELLFAAMALVTAITGFALLWKKRRDLALLLMLYISIPLVAIGVISTQLNVFVPRYVLGVATALMLLNALVIERGLSARNRSALLRLLALGLVVMLGWSLFRYYFDYTKAPDWRALAAYLAARTTADDLLVNTSADEAFTFYTQAYGVAGELAYMPANPRQSQDEIEGRLNAAFGEERTVWLGANPPAWPNARTGDEWLARNGLLLRDASVNGLRAQQFVAGAATESDDGLTADFGGVVRLLSATMTLPLEPDGSLPLALDFEALAQSDAALKTFVHVVGPVNPVTGTPLWAQDDQVPRDGLDTTAWEAGLRYRDVFRLPALDQLLPGDYAIVVGWYDPASDERLQTNGDDSVVLARLVVNELGELTLHTP